MRTAYLKHNLYVQSIVPEENLLIWNLKEGWEPLCKFLNHSIPDGPVPHDNRTGDTKYIENYAYKSKFFKVREGSSSRRQTKHVLFLALWRTFDEQCNYSDGESRRCRICWIQTVEKWWQVVTWCRQNLQWLHCQICWKIHPINYLFRVKKCYILSEIRIWL